MGAPQLLWIASTRLNTYKYCITSSSPKHGKLTTTQASVTSYLDSTKKKNKMCVLLVLKPNVVLFGLVVSGGYDGWTTVFNPSTGKRRQVGHFVSLGTDGRLHGDNPTAYQMWSK